MISRRGRSNSCLAGCAIPKESMRIRCGTRIDEQGYQRSNPSNRNVDDADDESHRMAARTTDWASPLGTFVVYVFDDDDNLCFISRTSSSNTWGGVGGCRARQGRCRRQRRNVGRQVVVLRCGNGRSRSRLPRARSASITDRWLSDGGYDGGGP